MKYNDLCMYNLVVFILFAVVMFIVYKTYNSKKDDASKAYKNLCLAFIVSILIEIVLLVKAYSPGLRLKDYRLVFGMEGVLKGLLVFLIYSSIPFILQIVMIIKFKKKYIMNKEEKNIKEETKEEVKEEKKEIKENDEKNNKPKNNKKPNNKNKSKLKK